MTATPRPWNYIDGKLKVKVHGHWIQGYAVAKSDIDAAGEARAALSDMLRYLEAGPIKLKSDIEHCTGKLKAVLAKLEGRE